MLPCLSVRQSADPRALFEALGVPRACPWPTPPPAVPPSLPRSMGGALATLCALDLRLSLGAPDVRLFTFGSPRVGNAIFAQWFERMIKVSCCRLLWAEGVPCRCMPPHQRGEPRPMRVPQPPAPPPPPPVGLTPGCQRLPLACAVQSHWRFTHNRDIVPSVPPSYMGFYHLSREVRRGGVNG